ncbi:type II toxin-antitoxin system RelE/ParE family toxin [candidate division KSB1 bacterium]|nr:type II toxin-antitoxin system RelE/ParE family toxin [candidate division KSB1 bacterium]
MKLVISSSAKLDLSEIVRYIADDNPQAARQWMQSVVDKIQKLSSFPDLGRVVPEYSDDSIREIIEGQYRIVYKINNKDDTICIIVIHHSKRRLI